ncbi:MULTISPECIES: hypothetical protein [Desulforamulus]|nr:hypothetical protein [Desulforamulus profundi]
MSLLTGLGTWLYLRLTKVKHKGQSFKKESPGSKQKKNLKIFLNIKDIQRGIVTLNGDRYRLILRVTAQDFYLLSEIEQNNAEDMIASALRGLEFPVQILMTSEALDTRKAVQALKNNAATLPEKIREHALERAIYLENLQQQRAVTARRAYLVIPFDTVKGLDYARAELYARAGSLMDALSRAKMTAEPLDTGGVCDLLSHLLNRGRTWRPSEAGEKGVISLFTISDKESA